MTDPALSFGTVAASYDRGRPTYPREAVAWALGERPLRVLELGAGTGKLTEVLVGLGHDVFATEPDERMLDVLSAKLPDVRATLGGAEQIPVGDQQFDVVIAGQAFDWFDQAAALPEISRVLAPGGRLVLLWNERDESDAFTAAYGEVLRTGPDAAAVEGGRGKAGFVLLECPLFEAGFRETFASGQELDEEGVLGRAFSASYAPKEPAAVEAFAAGLRAAFAAHQRDGKVTLRYETALFLARRR